VTLSNPSNATLGANTVHTYTINDNDALPSVEFDLISSSGDESLTPASLAVSLSAAYVQTVTVDYAVTGGTATGGGVDYTLAAGTLTFDPNDVSETIAITIVNDGLVESDETIQVTLSNPTNATLGVNTVHTYTINDNDVYPTVAFDLTASAGDESTTPASLAVSLSAAYVQTVTVDYAVTGGTATGGGVDYTLAAGTLTFDPNDISETVAITIVNDGLVESDETIQVTLSNPTNATLGVNTVHTYTILDNDAGIINVYTYAELRDAVKSQAGPGDIILVHPGVYQMNESRLSIYNAGTPGSPITVRGVMDGSQRPILEPAVGQEVDRGFFYMWEDDSHWVFENLEFRDLRGSNVLYSPNAGGMFILGDDVTVRNCTFHDCDQGISSASLAEGTLLENCEFYSNGSSLNLGYAHNMYMNDASLTVRGCYSHDAYGGMLFKVRSEHCVLEYCWLENDGSEQCIANAASGNANNALWRGNVFIKRSTPGGQRRMLSFDDGTGLIGTATLINNTIISATTSDIYLTSASSNACDLVLKNNLFAGPSDVLLDWNGGGSITGSDNCFRTAMSPDVPAGVVDSVFSDNPGLVDLSGRDLHLLSSSVCIDAGINNPTYLNELAQWVDGTPAYEPDTDLAPDLRNDDGSLDIGAYEGVSLPTPSVEFDLTASSGDESVATANLSVSLSAAYAEAVTVDFAVTGGTAVDPDDFTIAASPLTFNVGVTQQDMVITIVDDGLVESDETIEVTLSNPSNATLGANTVHTYTILDNDAAGEPETLFFDDFESGSFTAGGWTTSGSPSVSTSADYNGIYGARLRSVSSITKALSTVGYTEIHVTFWRRTQGLDSGEYLYCEWSDDGGQSWYLLGSTRSTSFYHEDFTCPSGADNNPNFRFRYRQNASSTREYGYVDDVEIIGTP